MKDRESLKKKRIVNRPPWDLIYALGLLVLAALLVLFREPVILPFAGFELEHLVGQGLRPPSATPTALSPSPSLTPTTPLSSTPSSAAGASIVIVVDDLGYNLAEARAVILSSQPLTLAVLPSLTYSLDIAREASVRGKDLLLHLPMESYQGNDWLGPGAIMTSMSEEEVRQQIQADLYDVPGAIGVNNHMGTKATASRETMSFVLRFLKDKGIFFLDSRVTAESVAGDLGEELGIKVLQNSVFLDNERRPDAVRKRLEELKQIAQRKGFAIGIAHAHCPALASTIEEVARNWQAEGVKIVPISALLSPVTD